MYVTFPAPPPPPPPPPPVPPPRPCRPVLPPPSQQELNFDLWYLVCFSPCRPREGPGDLRAKRALLRQRPRCAQLVLVPVMEVFILKDLPQQQAWSNEGLESMGLHGAMGLYQGYIGLWGYKGLWGYIRLWGYTKATWGYMAI